MRLYSTLVSIVLICVVSQSGWTQATEHEIEEIKNRAQEFMRQADEARERGRAGAATELQERARLMRRRVEEMTEDRRRREVEERVRREREAAEEARANARRFVEDALHELNERHQRDARRDPDRHQAGDHAGAERRIHHLRAAAENLHAAGMHEEANHLAAKAESEEQRLHAPPHGDEQLRRALADAHDRISELGRHLDRLTEHTEHLTRRIEELEEQLHLVRRQHEHKHELEEVHEHGEERELRREERQEDRER